MFSTACFQRLQGATSASTILRSAEKEEPRSCSMGQSSSNASVSEQTGSLDELRLEHLRYSPQGSSMQRSLRSCGFVTAADLQVTAELQLHAAGAKACSRPSTSKMHLLIVSPSLLLPRSWKKANMLHWRQSTPYQP